ncbi:hypothetical protein LCGC14_2761970 [marine sediment metagenome]|uniref:Uncharacterized protein n=1 Tax=marine sediment metagenome TaxID=412755 RepID=A0A0F8ZKK4_9ZZZZ
MFGKNSLSIGCASRAVTAIDAPSTTPDRLARGSRPIPAICIAILMLLSLRCGRQDGVAAVSADLDDVTATVQPAVGDEHEAILRQASEDRVGLLEQRWRPMWTGETARRRGTCRRG